MPIPELLRPPWRNFVIESPLARELAIRELRKTVAPRRYFRLAKVEEPFEGEVWADGFRICRIIRYRNSFLPLILGKFENAPSGSRVAVTMRVIWVVLAIWIVWMGFALFAAGMGPLIPLSPNSSRLLAIAVGASMPVFGYLLASIFFGIEARKARRMLTEILTGSRAAAESVATPR